MEARITNPLRFVFFVGCVTMAMASPWGIIGTDPRALELPVCSNHRATTPCKIILADPLAAESDVIARSRNDGQICTCPGESTCPVVWGEDPERTLAFHINIGGRQTSAQYKFCEPIVEDRPCVGDEIVASLGGHSVLPTQLEVKNCKCPSRDPLHLKQVVSSGFRRRQDFVCSMPTCDVNRSEPQPCMTLKSLRNGRTQTSEYQCECPDATMCRVQPNDLMNVSADQPVYGYCRRL